jgi:hypothetical protein
MPELDLIAYLDGEADPATARRLDAQLVSDPRLRSEALQHMRQRVVLARVLPTLAARPPVQRHWRIIGPVLAAAAVLAIATLLYRVAATPAPTGPGPTVASNNAIRLADGTTWDAGQAVHGGPADAMRYLLADGAILDLSVGTTLLAAVPGSAWRLASGALACELPLGSTALSGGISTDEALVRIDTGDIAMARDATGTRINGSHGHVVVQDRLTGASHAMDGHLCWIPADTVAPREVEGAVGTLRGIVVEVDSRRSMSLSTRFGIFAFRPEWIQLRPEVRGALDTAILRDVQVGEAIEMDWRHREHLRVIAIRKLTGIPADAVIPQTTTPDGSF